MSKILHLIVNYKNDDQTIDLIKNLQEIRGCEVVDRVIVNNSANDINDVSFEEKLGKSGKIAVINCPDNPGYFGGADRACRKINPLEYEFVILSNSDLKVLDSDFYQKLMASEIHSDVGAIAVSIISDLTKKESNPLYLKRPDLSKFKFLRCVYSNFIFAWIYHLLSWSYNRFLISKKSDRLISEIYALNGSFIILHRRFFQKGGSFAYSIKLYGEEIHLAEMLERMNLKTVFIPSLKVVHMEKGTEKSWLSRYAISYQTYRYKKEASKYLVQLFESKFLEIPR